MCSDTWKIAPFFFSLILKCDQSHVNFGLSTQYSLYSVDSYFLTVDSKFCFASQLYKKRRMNVDSKLVMKSITGHHQWEIELPTS